MAATNVQVFSGNVGIGTTSPDAKLHIKTGTTLSSSIESLRSNAAIRISAAGDNNDCMTFGLVDADNGTGNNPTGYIQNSWDTESDIGRPLVLNPRGGNVGIGIPNSLIAPLTIFKLGGAADEPGGGITLARSMPAGFRGASIWSEYNGGLNRDVLAFGVSSTSDPYGGTPQMMLDSSGNLTMSSGLLNVRAGSDVVTSLGVAKVGYVGHSNYAGFAQYQRATSTDYAMIHESGGTTYINCAAGSDINFRCANGQLATMKNTGRWGFGTSQPLAPIDVPSAVSGTVEINNNQTLRILNWSQNGDVAQNNDAAGVNVSINGDGGNITAHGFYAGYSIQFQSDRRIKKDIVEVQDDVALQKFRLLKPSKYKYIEPILSGRTQRDVFGFIAQEVQEVMPEAVTEGIVDGTCQGHIPNIMTLCTVDEQHITPEAYNNLTTEQKAEYFYSDQNEMDVGEEMANSYIREVITFSNTFDLSVITDNSYTASTTTKTTGDFEQDPETGEYWPVIFYDKNKVTSKKSIIKIIDSSSFIVDERLNTGNLIDGSEILCYGQQPGDFVRLNKDAIFTVTAAALQEVDRQQLSDKVRIATLESQYSNLLARVTVLESS
jgi:hypothetical protein